MYLIAKADVFGLVFLIDLYKIKGRSLINIIASSFNFPVSGFGVKDFSTHLSQGGKKYSTFILEAFKAHLKKYATAPLSFLMVDG